MCGDLGEQGRRSGESHRGGPSEEASGANSAQKRPRRAQISASKSKRQRDENSGSDGDSGWSEDGSFETGNLEAAEGSSRAEVTVIPKTVDARLLRISLSLRRDTSLRSRSVFGGDSRRAIMSSSRESFSPRSIPAASAGPGLSCSPASGHEPPRAGPLNRGPFPALPRATRHRV
jgi:hypothetical protein